MIGRIFVISSPTPWLVFFAWRVFAAPTLIAESTMHQRPSLFEVKGPAIAAGLSLALGITGVLLLVRARGRREKIAHLLMATLLASSMFGVAFVWELLALISASSAG